MASAMLRLNAPEQRRSGVSIPLPIWESPVAFSLNMAKRILPRVVCVINVLLLCTGVRVSGAIVDVSMTVTPSGGLFDYSVSVTNNGPLDVTLVSIIDAPTNDATIAATLSGPAGFLTLYDSGLGIIDFLENTSLFAVGATVGGFQFSSASAPPLFFTTFEAIDVAGVSTRGTIRITGTPPPRVPESGATLLLAIVGLSAVACCRFFLRPASSSDRPVPTT